MKIRNYILLTLVLTIGFISCKKDDDGSSSSVEVLDRTEQYAVELDSIETYLETHFYNYEEFETNPNAKIVFDTIDGVNVDKIPLINQVQYKEVVDINEDEDVVYKLYYLVVREGSGSQPTFGDGVFMNYEGNTIYGDVFDGNATPVWLSLPQTQQGFREVMVEFKSSDNFGVENDGTEFFENYGIGAMFIPSGTAYYEQYASGILPYSPLIFTFELMKNTSFTDSDGDGVLNILEDLMDAEGNLIGDRYLYDDDTDEDLIPNFLDTDDDGDGTPTSEEIIVEFMPVGDPLDTIEEVENEIENMTLDSNQFLGKIIEIDGGYKVTLTTLPDENGNGIPNYLDEDEDQSFDNN